MILKPFIHKFVIPFSQIRSSRLAEERAWPQPRYGDLVVGSTAHAGNLGPRYAAIHSSREKCNLPVGISIFIFIFIFIYTSIFFVFLLL